LSSDATQSALASEGRIGRQEEGADAVGVAGHQDLPRLLVAVRKGEDPVERPTEFLWRHPVEEGQEDEAVARALGYVDAVALCEGLIVIDFAVTDERVPALPKGLVTERRQAVDGEAGEAEEDTGQVREGRVLGAAGFQSLHRGLYSVGGGLRPSAVQVHPDAAHGLFGPLICEEPMKRIQKPKNKDAMRLVF
jgi:hypothetical protein